MVPQALAASAAAAAVFEPVNGPDLVLWLDALNIAGRGAAGKGTNGGPIATWADKSSYRNNAQQTNPSQRPVCVCEAEDGEVPFVRFHAASRQLRHSNLSTTAAYYADHRRRASVPMAALLADEPTQPAPKPPDEKAPAAASQPATNGVSAL